MVQDVALLNLVVVRNEDDGIGGGDPVDGTFGGDGSGEW